MKSTLIDAGPLIALFDRSDKYHAAVVKFIKENPHQLITSWPVLTEVCHMLDFNIKTQMDFLKWVKMGGVAVPQIMDEDISRIIELSEKYSNVPMDLADASLVVMAERLDIKEIVSIDSDYYIYRTMKKEMIRNIFR